MIAPLLAASLALHGPNRLVTIARGVDFPAARSQTVYLDVRPGFLFDEVIPSWNVGSGRKGGKAEDGAVKVELRLPTGRGTKGAWMNLGSWSLGGDWAPRESEKAQRDESGRVSTDTLMAKIPVDRADVRLTLTTRPGAAGRPRLKHLSLAFADTKAARPAREPERAAWGRTVDVPQRAQGNYPRGSVLCSATSTSMLLDYYSKRLGRPELDRDVPEVEAKVWDRAYNGAGNWPFNAAYAGSFEGLTAAVARLDSVADLETLVAAGFPVACSVSFDLLRGKPLSAGESGHLIVLVGFTEDGTPVVNDPAFKAGVRKTYPREDFLRGWDYSDHTVYLYRPEGAAYPPDPKGLWTFGEGAPKKR